jgi:methyl-accepting chemotaxis protein
VPTIFTASVRNQLRLAFAIVIAMSFLSTSVAIWRLQVLANDTNQLTHRPLAKERLVSSWLLNISMSAKRTAAIARSSRRRAGHLLRQRNPGAVEKHQRAAEAGRRAARHAGRKTLYAEIGAARDAYVSTRDRVMALKAEGKTDEARTLYDQTFAAVMDRYIDKVKELQVLQQKEIEASRPTGARQRAAQQDRADDHVLRHAGLQHRCRQRVLARPVPPPGRRAGAGRHGGRRDRGRQPARRGPLADGDQTSLMAGLARMRDSLSGIVGQVRHGTGAIGESIAVLSSEAQELSPAPRARPRRSKKPRPRSKS